MALVLAEVSVEEVAELDGELMVVEAEEVPDLVSAAVELAWAQMPEKVVVLLEVSAEAVQLEEEAMLEEV